MTPRELADDLIARGNNAEADGNLAAACDSYRRAAVLAPDHPGAHLNLGIALAASGDLPSAVECYERALAIDPRHPAANYNLAIAVQQKGDLARAECLLLSALVGRPEFPDAKIALANVYDEQGRRDEAVVCLRAALQMRPDHAGAWNNLGLMLDRAGDVAGATEAFRRAAVAGPPVASATSPSKSAAAEEQHAVELFRQGRYAEAADHFLEVTRLQPQSGAAFSNLGVVLRQLGRGAEALAAHERAIALDPENAAFHLNLTNDLALELFRQGRYAEAEGHFLEVTRLQPQSGLAFSNLGAVLNRLGRGAQALAAHERAIALDPANAVFHLNLATDLGKTGSPLEAVQRMRQAVAAFPDDPHVQYHAGRLFHSQGLRGEALAAFSRALELDPEFIEARWMAAMEMLPQAYGPDEWPEEFRQQFASGLDALEAWSVGPRAKLGHRGVGEGQPFHLAFQERDNVSLLSRYGDLCARVMRSAAVAIGSGTIDSSPRLRLAIVSGQIFDQSVWTALVRGWCDQLDSSRFEVHLFHTGTTCDAETNLGRARAASFHFGAGDVFNWAEAIQSVHPHAILYPELGMDPMCAKLAALRLAPVQLVSWGHPETSGLPTLDYYISAAAFEPPLADANYREKLISLPNLGCYYDALKPEFSAPDWAALGVDAFAPRLLCAGTPYKYMPEHDPLLAEIARRVADVQMLFFIDRAPFLSEQIERRLTLVFADAGLDAARHVKFLPRQSRSAFFGMMRDCDGLLDTVGFSGFNTAMQAIECDLPVVAWEGRFMRGRLASGTLRTMEMGELVATTPQQFIDLAAKLCSDSSYRHEVAGRISQQKHILFRDLSPVRALEDVLLRITGHSK